MTAKPNPHGGYEMMMGATEFLQFELETRENREGRIDRSVREQQKAWIEPDFMDFAERYGDYVCSYEKSHDRRSGKGLLI